MKRLIVNADDFGLHESVNRGIHIAHTSGIVTSTSLMAGGSAFEEAVQIQRSCPDLGVGVHLTLVGGCPVAPVDRVPSLVDGQGRFCPSYPAFLARCLRGGITLAEVEQELAVQIEKVLLAGVTPTHLDSHQHMHVVPGIDEIVLGLARRFSIRSIRIPAEPLCFFGGIRSSAGRIVGRTGLTALARRFRQKAVAAGISVTGHFFGMLAGGRMDETALLAVIQGLPEGTSEIMVHPGVRDEALAAEYAWGYQWDGELAALCADSVKRAVRQQRVQLISYRDL